MNWKTLLLCALFLGSVPCVRASDPMTYREIAMLLRNGEDQQFIISDTTERKLLQALSPAEAADLVSLGAKPALMNILNSPSVIAQPQAVAAYDADLQHQKALLLQQQQQDELQAQQEAAEEAHIRQQNQQQLGLKTAPAPDADGAAAVPAASSAVAGKPLSLKFIAADGTPVDLDNLRGKVVLVDFWATWCHPCMGEVPNVVAAYKKYHGHGFEVIGISLDQSKEKMLEVTAAQEMTWPQYFDGKGWSNEISTSFHIQSIPTMWLVNKQGIVEYPNARADLDGSIAKLLAE